MKDSKLQISEATLPQLLYAILERTGVNVAPNKITLNHESGAHHIATIGIGNDHTATILIPDEDFHELQQMTSLIDNAPNELATCPDCGNELEAYMVASWRSQDQAFTDWLSVDVQCNDCDTCNIEFSDMVMVEVNQDVEVVEGES